MTGRRVVRHYQVGSLKGGFWVILKDMEVDYKLYMVLKYKLGDNWYSLEKHFGYAWHGPFFCGLLRFNEWSHIT